MEYLQGFFVLERYGSVRCRIRSAPLFVSADRKNRHPLQSGLDTAVCLASVRSGIKPIKTN